MSRNATGHNAKTLSRGAIVSRRLFGGAAAAIVATLFFAPGAQASKQAVDFFGGTGTQGGLFQRPEGVAVNESGAGGVPAGTVYVTDGGSFDEPSQRGNRVERFQRNDNGTPGTAADDTYEFISAWGAGVEKGGTNFEICTVAANCREAAGGGGDGTLAGDGMLSKPSGIAVDQDTGDVYVSDNGARRAAPESNFRISVYDAQGSFLRSFGYDVVESGPDDNGTGYEICKAGIDVCKAGLSGSGLGQLGGSRVTVAEGIALSPGDGNPATGTVFLADTGNHRIDTYALDGTSPGSIGSAATFGEHSPHAVAVDSRGIVYASNAANSNEIERYDSQNADGGGVGFLAPIAAPPLLASSTSGDATQGLAVDPDSDGPGPDSDVLYVLRNQGGPGVVQQFGPLNAPGLTAPPSAVDDTHATDPSFSSAGNALASEASTGRLYVAAIDVTSFSAGPGVYVLDNVGPPPSVSLDSVGDATAHGFTAHATIDPHGPPDTHYHFEYSADGTHWTSTPDVDLGSQETPQAVEVRIEPPLFGLQSNTLYHVRLVAARRFATPVITPEKTITTLPEQPQAETTGSPVRSATSAELQGRVDPDNSATEYFFEYGTQGSCDANPCESTPAKPAGAGGVTEYVAEPVAGLLPGTTYHYRLIAGNGAPGSPVFGQDMTFTTRASDAPLSHGHLPGPTGSDRAWEQVSIADSGGNGLSLTMGFSDDGNRALYGILGGTPISESGSFLGIYFAERKESAPHLGSWQTSSITPPRAQLVGPNWSNTYAPGDLSTVVSKNFSSEGEAVWRFGPEQQPERLFQPGPPQEFVQFSNGGGGPFDGISTDGTRTIAGLRGGALDPAFPAAATVLNLYDISSGTPQLASLLPGNVASPCGATGPLTERHAQERHWISADGSFFFFTSKGPECGTNDPSHLYLRDIPAEETRLVAKDGTFVKLTPAGAFFSTKESLDPSDSGGDDLYRYDVGAGSYDCVTCVVPNFAADAGGIPSDDGSRIYFSSPKRLLPQAPSNGTGGVYRLDVKSGDLAYVAPSAMSLTDLGSSISPDGAYVVFRSASPTVDALGGPTNNGTAQYYLYDDHDRSLTCISCPRNGASATEDAPAFDRESGPNLTLLADNGDFAFMTTTPLVGADQNTPPGSNRYAGTDVYEWRDGRQLLVSDGLTQWPAQSAPVSLGIDPSGQDIFFSAAAQYTADAPDAYIRLYDARIGGGFEFPPPAKPCPLEVCQGTPKGAPEEAPPGTSSLAGPGNAAGTPRTRCAKGRRAVKRKGKLHCLAPKAHHHRKGHKRRNAR